eukprot:1015243-Amphidinium_carterae.2
MPPSSTPRTVAPEMRMNCWRIKIMELIGQEVRENRKAKAEQKESAQPSSTLKRPEPQETLQSNLNSMRIEELCVMMLINISVK